ncbi:unnamed protein product [Prorocentrum cordatum]|uniref:Spermidine synthase n=1 Tax=Prorocentrum cordatum TaxID=2364126 RepID=A0ABN9UNC7_9DINO|nr:unnamed protein product [Polarella glacialis]
MVSVALAALSALGAPALRTGAGAGERTAERLRVLCIGLGAGVMPSFLSHHVPLCDVDAVELEPAVVAAALGPLGFREGPGLRAITGDGAAFALEAVSAAGASVGGLYDAVLIDAFDAAGDTPAPLWSGDGGVCQALAQGLLRADGVLAVNLLESVDVASRLGAYRRALAACGRDAGPGFSVRTSEWEVRARGAGAQGGEGEFDVVRVEGGAGNYIAVQACGGLAGATLEELQGRLTEGARGAQEATGCPFDIAELAVRGLRQW